MPDSTLSGLDWQIIELLQSDGRITISELASQLNRSRSNISEHLEKLIDSGVINNFEAKVDSEKLGFGLKAFVRLSADSEHHRKIINVLIEKPEVAECHVLTGSELVIIQVVAKNMPHLRNIVDSLTQYGSTQTDVVFATVKQQLKVDKKLRRIIEG